MMIASRILTLKNSDRDIAIPVGIFAPKHEGDARSCTYEIGWPEGKSTMTAWGFDSVQALVVALQMIGADVYSSSYHKSGKLMLKTPGNGYGFPGVSSLRDMLEATTRKSSSNPSSLGCLAWMDGTCLREAKLRFGEGRRDRP